MGSGTKVCMGCMSEMEHGAYICPICGHDSRTPNPEEALPQGTMLGKYYIGAAVSQNDLIIEYMAFDTEGRRKVLIKEFFPRSTALRAVNGMEVLVGYEHQAAFRTLLSDYSDRWKRLSKIESRSLVPILDIFQANNTAYRVSLYMPLRPLNVILEERGKMSPEEVKTAFLPLFTLLSRLHNIGIYHCGISPETVKADEKGQLVLTGFSLPELRTLDSGYKSILYDGYSAPEQYSKALWQGEWTDIYSLGALIYKALSGVTPPTSITRRDKDRLKPLSVLEPTVPEAFCAAVRKLLSLIRGTDSYRQISFLRRFWETKSPTPRYFRHLPARIKRIISSPLKQN